MEILGAAFAYLLTLFLEQITGISQLIILVAICGVLFLHSLFQ